MTAALLSKPDSLVGQQPGPSAMDQKIGRAKKARSAKVPERELLELTGQAELHNQRIVESEISAVDDYWLLGRVLERVRDNFPRRTWQPWLEEHKIDLTRAKRARLLAEMFAATEEMAGLTVHAALAIARRRKKAQPVTTEPDLARKFKSAVKKLLDISADLIADDAPRQYSPLAAQLAEATTAICRACSAAEKSPATPAGRKKPR